MACASAGCGAKWRAARLGRPRPGTVQPFEVAKPFEISRNRVIVQVSLNDASQPPADRFDRQMASSHQAFPDRFQRRAHPLGNGQPPHDEASIFSAFRADVREAGKVESFRSALAAPGAAFKRIAPELQYACLFLVEGKAELAQAHAQAGKKGSSILGPLKPHNAVVGISDDDHIPFGLPPPPLMRPQVEDIMQAGIGKQR